MSGRGIRRVEIGERDRFILYLLDKFRVLDSKSLSVLGGFSESYGVVRLRKLADYGYLKREKLVGELPLVNWLTVKGYECLRDEKKRIGKPRLGTIEHEIKVGQVAAYLVEKKGLEPNQLITDRDLRIHQGKSKDNRIMERKADLLFLDPQSGKKIAVEVELTYKGETRTVENIKRNRGFSDEQYWFIPKARKGLESVLLANGCQVDYLEKIDIEGNKKERDFTLIEPPIKRFFAGGKIVEEEGGVLSRWRNI